LRRARTAAEPIFQSVRVETPPVIGGDLDDPAWAIAPEISAFF
jgi:hypothetical protein